MLTPSTLGVGNRALALPRVAATDTSRRTRWVFASLCLFVLAQAFMLPIVTKGPTWALWPTLADIAIVAMIAAATLAYPAMGKPSAANRTLFLLLMIVVWGWLFSYCYPILFPQGDSEAAPIHGIYYIYRLIQFVALFFVVAHLPLPPARIAILRRVTGIALVLACLGVFVTYFDIVPRSSFAGHIPTDRAVSGPWAFYGEGADPDLSTTDLQKFGADKGLGTIGYNHGYTALQVFMLFAFYLHLGRGRPKAGDGLLLLLAIMACFLSESRDGLLTILLFAGIYWVRRPLHALPVFLVAGALAVVLPFVVPKSGDDGIIAATFSRQGSLFAEKSDDNLAGRQTIWAQKIAFVNEYPVRWVLGAGLGALWDDNAPNAHMLYLQVLVECGLLGLLFFLYLACSVLALLRRHEQGMQAIYWATVVLLIASFTQENFYPVAAFSHFVAFYLCTLAIAFRDPISPSSKGASE